MTVENYTFQDTDEVALADGSARAWTDGWVRLRVTEQETKISKGGYPEIDISFVVDDGILSGKKVKLLFPVPTKARAFKVNGEIEYWGRKFMWLLKAFGALPFGTLWPEDAAMEGFLANLPIIDKVVVAKVKAGTATITDQRTGDPKVIGVANIERLWPPDHQPEEGFIVEAPMIEKTAKVSVSTDDSFDTEPDVDDEYLID